MKHLFIRLSSADIQKTRKYLLKLKRQIPKMLNEFFELTAKWIIDRANTHLKLADIGENVKSDIMSGWTIKEIPNGIQIINRAQKAVFVEFGVGIVGEVQKHPQAISEGYQYNVDSYYKDEATGTWIFKSTMADLDIPQEQAEFIKDNGDYVVITRGTKGVWYAYNAIVDAQVELAKANGGDLGAIWENIERKYIK